MSVMPALKRVELLKESYSAVDASISLKPDCPYALTVAKATKLSKARYQCMICCEIKRTYNRDGYLSVCLFLATILKELLNYTLLRNN